MTPVPIALSLVLSPEHNSSGHPENVDRFRHFSRLDEAPFAPSLLRLTPRPATEQDLTGVHPEAYLHALKDAVSRGPGYIDYAPTYVTQASYEAALAAAGGTLVVAESVARGEASAGFALVRPPGHHATPTQAMGFCLLNNIALATRRVQQLGFRRVMIVDFDVHHGNGTQAVFESDPEVLYLSTHQSGIYPGTGFLNETGEADGAGTVINLPLPAGAGDRAFAEILDRVVRPAAERFRPQFLLASAGFDAHWVDPLAELQLTCTGFYHIALALADLARHLCEGRLVFVLEGGYDPEALAGSVAAVLTAVAGLPAPADPLGLPRYPEPSVDSVLRNALAIHGL